MTPVQFNVLWWKHNKDLPVQWVVVLLCLRDQNQQPPEAAAASSCSDWDVQDAVWSLLQTCDPHSSHSDHTINTDVMFREAGCCHTSLWSSQNHPEPPRTTHRDSPVNLLIQLLLYSQNRTVIDNYRPDDSSTTTSIVHLTFFTVCDSIMQNNTWC